MGGARGLVAVKSPNTLKSSTPDDRPAVSNGLIPADAPASMSNVFETSNEGLRGAGRKAVVEFGPSTGASLGGLLRLEGPADEDMAAKSERAPVAAPASGGRLVGALCFAFAGIADSLTSI